MESSKCRTIFSCPRSPKERLSVIFEGNVGACQLDATNVANCFIANILTCSICDVIKATGLPTGERAHGAAIRQMVTNKLPQQPLVGARFSTAELG